MDSLPTELSGKPWLRDIPIIKIDMVKKKQIFINCIVKTHDLETNPVQYIVQLIVKFYELLSVLRGLPSVPIVILHDLLRNAEELITKLDRESLIYCEIVVPICFYNGKSLSNVS